MEAFRKLPIGIQSFEKLRAENFLYVDKTAFIYDLVRDAQVYFLSRPRRFGKSLFLSTLKAYFEGKKELFAGLKIDGLERGNPDAWKKHPVLYISFGSGVYQKDGTLAENLNYIFSEYESAYGITEKQPSLSLRFVELVKTARRKTGLGVVVLIDEYDKPLLESGGQTLDNNKALFKGVFGALKDLDECLRFVFITGVTKFSKVSIFSDLNQLRDISLTRKYAAICGITEAEMLLNFAPEIERTAEVLGITKDECILRLKKMYDGYHFFEEGEGVYNPFSLISAFSDQDLKPYWFSTGTPTFLIQKLKQSRCNYMDFTRGVEATAQEILDYRSDNPNPIPLFYQTGYLTIKDFDKNYGVYALAYPNDEVKYAFINSLAPSVLQIQSDKGLDIVQFSRDIAKGDIDAMMSRFKSLFASLPYPTLAKEKADSVVEQNFQNVFYLVFTLLGQWSRVEETSSQGRADCVLETEDAVYVFEFKRDASADDALAQIEAGGYAKPYESSGKKIVKIGASFSTELRNLAEWKIA